MHFLKGHKIIFLICFILFIIPFFWLKPGEMDLGGDASRLYFYDPVSYLRNLVLYSVSPQGTGPEFSYQFGFVFTILLAGLKAIFKSPYILITLFNSLTLVLGFLSMYRIVVEFLILEKKEKTSPTLIQAIGVLVGLFYLFSPMMIRGGWDRALLDHTQVFINPLMFWLILRFINTQREIYLVGALIATFIFAHNFSFTSAPKFFAFFPLAFIFLGLYVVFVRRLKIKIKLLVVSFLLFLGLQAFHIVPQVVHLFDQESLGYFKIVSSDAKKDAINFFIGISQYVRVSENLAGLAPATISFFGFDAIFFIFPTIFIVGLLLNRSLVFLLIFLFFLVIFFMLSGSITNSGLQLYQFFFKTLPGFTMFRSFFGQWMHIYMFFYSLLFGFSLFYILKRLRYSFQILVFIFLLILILASGIPLIKGDVVRAVLTRSAGVEVRAPIKMDPKYEEALAYIKNDPIDGKYLTLPLVDHFYQIVAGSKGGAYLGPSTIAYLTGKKDFGSSQILNPFTDVLLKDIKAENYDNIYSIFPVLNIRRIFYNSDSYIYENFLDFPYQQMREYMPQNQNGYKEFITKLPVKEEVNFGNKYFIYKVDDDLYLPHIYVAKNVKYVDSKENKLDHLLNNFLNGDIRTAVIDKSEGLDFSVIDSVPKVTFQKINNTKYIIDVENATDPFLLVFSEQFNSDWKLFLKDKVSTEGKIIATYFDGDIKEKSHLSNFLDKNTFETLNKNSIANNQHFMVDMYANAWYISPNNTDDKTNYTLILEMTSQRAFYLGLTISLAALVICIIWFAVLVWRASKFRK